MISLLELGVLALAGYRATQLAVHDTLLDPVRDRVHAWHANRPESTTRTAVITLISCIYCTGWWAAGALLAIWLFWGDNPLVQFGLLWLAVAGGAALLNRWDDTRPEAGA